MTYQGNKNINSFYTKKPKKRRKFHYDDGTCDHEFVQISMKWNHCIKCKRYRLR